MTRCATVRRSVYIPFHFTQKCTFWFFRTKKSTDRKSNITGHEDGKRSISWKWCKIYKNSHKGLQNVEREKKNVAHFVVVRSRKSVSGQLKIKECSFFSCIRPNINILLLLFLFCIVIFEPIALCRFLVRHNSGIWSHK